MGEGETGRVDATPLVVEPALLVVDPPLLVVDPALAAAFGPVMVISNAELGAERSPAESANVALTLHAPAPSVGKVHEVALPTMYEQDRNMLPFVAVTVTMSPEVPPTTENVGVVSLVTLSVSDTPVSDEPSKSGVAGALGADATMVTASGGLATLVLPAPSVNFAETDHTPRASTGSVHDVAEPTTYEHDSVEEPFVAVTVTMSPEVPPTTENVGVVSLVTLSVSDTPVSDEPSKSGVAGALGADGGLVAGVGASMNMLKALLVADTLPAGSVRVAVTFHVPPVSVGKSHDCVPDPMV